MSFKLFAATVQYLIKPTFWIRKIKLSLVVILLCGLTIYSEPQTETDNKQFLKELRNNIVQIFANRPGGVSRAGFGFIVGEDKGRLYIVTANHLVRGEGPGQIAKKALIKLFYDQGVTHEATLLGTSSQDYDLAILRIKLPSEFVWSRATLGWAVDIAPHKPVWVISDNWEIPPHSGSIESLSVSSDIIQVRDLPIQPGLSGTPLIAESGMVGMMTVHHGRETGVSNAVHINIIKKIVEKWNAPFDLVESWNIAGNWKAWTDGHLEDVLITRKAHRWHWNASGWGGEPVPQAAVLQSKEGWKYRFSDGSSCLEGRGEYEGEPCTHVVISEDGNFMSVCNGDTRISMVERKNTLSTSGCTRVHQFPGCSE